jgi:hypothetical protein
MMPARCLQEAKFQIDRASAGKAATRIRCFPYPSSNGRLALFVAEFDDGSEEQCLTLLPWPIPTDGSHDESALVQLFLEAGPSSAVHDGRADCSLRRRRRPGARRIRRRAGARERARCFQLACRDFGATGAAGRAASLIWSPTFCPCDCHGGQRGRARPSLAPGRHPHPARNARSAAASSLPSSARGNRWP